ncbi:hypothetical protein [Vibrio phage vB_ValS_PJ32]|nr:hypothetical protein [Vibrio phage vB_ValS_PJ32]
MADNDRVVKVRARSLKNADATFISMVDRGANRLPIRMLKNEGSNMFDLNQLFLRGGSKKSEAQPQVMGMLVPESTAEGYVAALKSEDQEVFLLDTPTEGVKFVSYKEEASLDGAMILKGATDESPAIVVDTAQKMLSDFGFDPEQGFAGSVISHGFYSNLDGAMRVLFDAMWNVMETAEPGEAPVERVQTLLSEFTAYVTSLMQTVPMEAFKMEKLTPVVAEGEKEEGDNTDGGEAAVTTEGGAETGTEAGTDAGTDSTVESSGTEPEGGTTEAGTESGDPGAETGETTEGAKNEGEDPLQQILAQMSSLGQQISTIGESVNGLKSEVSTIQDKVTEQTQEIATVRDGVQKAEKAAEQAVNAASGVVIDTDEGRTDGQKSEEDYNPDRVERRNRNIEYT